MKINLCIQCNYYEGYYPVNFKGYNLYPNGFNECFNNKTKLINFYFNEEKKHYEPCFETCNTCNYGGNEEINNCTSCDIDSIFRPEIHNTTNCVKKCKYRYYYMSYGQYKCTENNQCPKEAKLFIREKNKCIEDCKLDDIYKYQYNGECLQKCLNGTTEENNICINVDKNKCTFIENENSLMEDITKENLDLLIKVYCEEYNYTNNHISIYKNDLYSITIYKNKNCINNLSLNTPQIDFGTCYEIIKSKNNIYSDLIILIIERYYNDSSFVLYDFYSPITGDKIDISNECQNINITIEKDILILLKGVDNFEKILELAQQNINIFDKSNDFYNDICFNYISPNGKDIPIKDRLKEFYPNITLCNEGCLFKEVNLISMQSICQCQFNDFIGSSSITQNAFVSKISEEIREIIFQSNLQILLCYKNVFIYKYFAKNTGGFIILTIIIFQIACLVVFRFYHSKKINNYVFILMETYLSFLDKSNIEKDKSNIISFLNYVSSPPSKKSKKGNNAKVKKRKKKNKTVIYQNNTNIIKLNINNLQVPKSNFSKEKNNKEKNIRFSSNNISNISKTNKKSISNLSILNSKDSDSIILKNNQKKKRLSKFKDSHETNKDIKIEQKLKDFIDNYLSTDLNEKDFDDAIQLDKRKFCQYFWERIKTTQFIIDISLVYEPIRPRSIKFLLFLINIDLYFLVNGLFMNEDYISKIYHSDDDSFLSLLKRINQNFFYVATIEMLSSYLITFLFPDERKLKHIFIKEKEKQFNIQK